MTRGSIFAICLGMIMALGHSSLEATESSKGGVLGWCSSLLKTSGLSFVRSAGPEEVSELRHRLEQAKKVSIYLRGLLGPEADQMIHFPHLMILQGVYHEHTRGVEVSLNRVSQLEFREELQRQYQDMEYYSSLVELEYLLQSRYHKTLSGIDQELYLSLIGSPEASNRQFTIKLAKDRKALEKLAKNLSGSPLLLEYDMDLSEKLHSLDFIEILATLPRQKVKELVEMWPEKLDRFDEDNQPPPKRSLSERLFSRAQQPDDPYQDQNDSFHNRALFSLYHATARSLVIGHKKAQKENLPEIIEIESDFLKRSERWEEVQKMLEAIAKRMR